MKFKKITLLLFVFSLHLTFSQNLDLSILTVPDSLTQNANSIVRFYDTNIELITYKKMIIKVKKAITVLNKLGDHESTITVYYDKNTNIRSLRAIAYDSFGKELKKVSKGKFDDYAAADGISLFNDNRLKYYRHVPVSYPYTIYYEYEVETSNTAFIPRWIPIDSYLQSVEKASFTISHPNEIILQKSERNFNDFKIKHTPSENQLKYILQTSIAIKPEEYSPTFLELFPSVKLASNKFHLEGYDGIANSWEEFGLWMYQSLIKGRDQIPEATKQKVLSLVKNVDDPIEKARLIYDFVQKKTRYISVQVGIGGWMPMLANDVDRLSYGDCKALTNYTKSLLDVAGVESYYTAVYAGNNKRSMEDNVVSVQGNHAFLYVPSKEKDYWLECTSQTTPFGYQGTFTDDRNVLVITPQGGKIKRTNVHSVNNNYLTTLATYNIDSLGNLSANVTITTKGTQYRDHYLLERETKKDIDEHYKSDYWPYLNNLSVNKVSFKNNRREISFQESLDISSDNYASTSGSNMLITLNAFNKYARIPKRYRSRKFAVQISRGFLDEDEFLINLPKGYTIEALPSNKTVETKFGNYKITIEKITSNQIKYQRKLLINKGLYPKEDYKAYRKFRKTIAKLDNTKVILTKN